VEPAGRFQTACKQEPPVCRETATKEIICRFDLILFHFIHRLIEKTKIFSLYL